VTAPVRRLCVIGVGLIGGSFARALREKGLAQKVVGVGRSEANLIKAKRLGVVDHYFTDDPAEAVREADLVFFSTPVRAMPEIVKTISRALAPDCIVTDAGSTKASLIQAIEPLLPDSIQFVPGHPIAGKEKSGVRASKANLFNERWVILTPTARTKKAALARVRGLWEACGAWVECMPPAEHDQVFGAVSHLPHLVAYALVDTIMGWDSPRPLIGYSAGGFRDFTRIAASSPEMWRDICLENRKAILKAMDRYGQTFAHLRQMVESGDGRGLEKLFSDARAVKAQLRHAKRLRAERKGLR
jgi:prephenate dehydrogenase